MLLPIVEIVVNRGQVVAHDFLFGRDLLPERLDLLLGLSDREPKVVVQEMQVRYLLF